MIAVILNFLGGEAMTKYLLLLLVVGGALMLMGQLRHQRMWLKIGSVILGLGILFALGFALMVMLSPNM